MRTTTGSLPAVPAGTWRLDSGSAHVELSTQVFGRTVRVVFDEVSGLVDIGSSPLDSSVSLSIQAASLNSGNRRRDHYLRSHLGLDVGRFPIIAFHGSTTHAADAQTLVVEGELAVRGHRVPVTLPVSVRSVDGCRTDLVAHTETTPNRLGLRLPLPFGPQKPGIDPPLRLKVCAAIGDCVSTGMSGSR